MIIHIKRMSKMLLRVGQIDELLGGSCLHVWHDRAGTSALQTIRVSGPCGSGESGSMRETREEERDSVDRVRRQMRYV